MSLFGAGPQPQPTPTPTATTPMIVGVTPWPTAVPYLWEPTSSDGTSPVVCVADPSTTPAYLQPYLINAACTNLVGQLEPDQAALLMQQVESGKTELGLVRVGDFWVLQAIDRGSTEPRILATAQDEGDEGGPAANTGGATGSGGAAGSAIDDAERIATERHVAENGALANIDQATLDTRKFENYSLDPANPNNDGKAQGLARLGYDVSTVEGRLIAAADIIRQVDPQLEAAPAVYSETTVHGAKFELRSVITGPNGSTGTLVTVWIYEEGSQIARLVTNWVEVHK